MGVVNAVVSRVKRWMSPEPNVDSKLAELSRSLATCRARQVRVETERRAISDRIRANQAEALRHRVAARNAAAALKMELAHAYLAEKTRCEEVARAMEEQRATFASQSARLAELAEQMELFLDSARRRRTLVASQVQCAEVELLMGGAEKQLAEDLDDRLIEGEVRLALERRALPAA